MDKFYDLIISNEIIQWILIGFLLLIALMLIILFIQYNIDRAKGRHAKFLWFEVNAGQSLHDKHKQDLGTSVHGKNINTGDNYGSIGDKYTGLRQREVTQDDIVLLTNEIRSFAEKHSNEIIETHITLGFPGCKETTNLANKLYPILNRMGYMKIQRCTLLTFGVTGKKFGVSNAFDNSIMIEIYPPDNVE